MRLAHTLTLAAALVAITPALAAAQHEGHVRPAPAPSPAQPSAPPTPDALPPSVRPITDADRAAAFPDVPGHAVHDRAIHTFVLIDRLEWQSGDGEDALAWDLQGWVGGDRDRLWFRSDAARSGGRFTSGDVHALYGRAISPWWDVVAGIRQDVRPGPPQTWAAVGIQGLAPYWIRLELTGYVGGGGRTAVRLEAEHEMLLTNRLVLQPLVEAEIFGKDDPERDVAAGFSSMDVGLRLRYEIRREIAPYVGVTWHRTFFGTADLARRSGEPASHARVVAGMRLWM